MTDLSHGAATGAEWRAPALLDHPYGQFVERMQKPAQYVGAEYGAVRKAWGTVRHHVCLAFPDLYEVGASHLGLRILYRILNEAPDTLAERCFCPWSDLEAELRRRALPLVSLEGRRPLAEFDVLGFSLQYELTFTNVLTMLELGRVPIRSADRSDHAPLVLGGGPGATHPEPVADFFDAFVLGDGEQALLRVARRWAELRATGAARAERLRALADIEGVYVPLLYHTELDSAHGRAVVAAVDADAPWPVRRTLAPLDEFPFPSDGPVGGPEAVFDRVSIELARGCDQGCRFCQAGMIYRPKRERTAESVVDAVRGAVRHSGADELSLTALSPADVSCLGDLLCTLGPELAGRGVSLAVSSLRAYGLAPALLEELTRLRAAGLTFAPEAGSQRLRDVINKNITTEQLLEAAERACALGWSKLKLYFMIGLPSETDDDVRAIIQTAAAVARVGRKAARRALAVTVSVSTFVPKPHTPLQWMDMAPPDEIERKQRLLRAAVRGERALKLRVHAVRTSVLEGALSRGDRTLSGVIESAWRLGARFDAWDEQLRFDLWEQAFAAAGRTMAGELHGFPVGGPLPWSHLEAAVTEPFLRRELRRGLGARPSPTCGQLGKNDNLICYRCGAACPTPPRADRAAASAEPRHAAAVPETAAPPLPPGEQPRPAADAAAPACAARRHNPVPRGHRTRFELQKLGPAALLSHLDLVRELPRVLRRAGVAMELTGGFHPKPAMSFGPALALGVPSLQEYLDIRLAEPLDQASLDAALPRLGAASPEGLRFLAASRLPDDEPTISRRIRIARYAVLVGLPPTGQPLDEAELRARIAATLSTTSVTVARGAEPERQLVELRPSLLGAEPATIATRAALEAARIPPGASSIEVDVALGPGPCPKPSELGAVLLGVPPDACRAVRLALLPDASDRARPVMPG